MEGITGRRRAGLIFWSIVVCIFGCLGLLAEPAGAEQYEVPQSPPEWRSPKPDYMDGSGQGTHYSADPAFKYT